MTPPSRRLSRPTGRTPKSGIVVPHPPTLVQRCAARIVFAIERIATGLVRWEITDRSECFTGPRVQPVIFCVWHNRLAISMAAYRKLPRARQPSRRLAALVSASRDGALLARILENFGVQPVRGSSSRRGAQALLELSTWAEQGYDLAITPDGPRGPRYRVQEGAITLAQITELPIVPVVCRIQPKVSLRSWDAFQVPLPFGKVDLEFKAPLHIAREASPQERESVRLTLERALGE